MADRKIIDIIISTLFKATGVDAAVRGVKSLASATKNFSVAAGRNLMNVKAGVDLMIGAVNGVRAAFSSAFRFEYQTRQFKHLIGTIDEARAHMETLKRLGDTPPFSLDEFANASKRMMSMTDGVLGYQHSLELVGDTSAATGRSLDEIADGFARLYMYIRDGQPLSRAVMQFRNMGIITPEVAKKIMDMQKAGASSVDIWAEVTKSLERFKGAMAETEKTSEGLVASIGTKLTNIWRNFATVLMNEAKPALEATNDLLGKIEKAETTVSAKTGKSSSSIAVAAKLAYTLIDPVRSAKAAIKLNGMKQDAATLAKTPSDVLDDMVNERIARAKANGTLDRFGTSTAYSEAELAQLRTDLRRRIPNSQAYKDRVAGLYAKQDAIANPQSAGNPFGSGNIQAEYFAKGWIGANGSATDKWYRDNNLTKPEEQKKIRMWDENGHATPEYIAMVAADKQNREAKERETRVLQEKFRQQQEALRVEKEKKDAETAYKDAIKQATEEIKSGNARLSTANSWKQRASTEFEKAFAWYRDPTKAAAGIGEEVAYAADYKRLGRDAARYGGKWRIDALAALASDPKAQAAQLEEWRKSRSFTPQVEALVRAAAADKVNTTAEEELRKITENTANLDKKLDELLAMKGGE